MIYYLSGEEVKNDVENSVGIEIEVADESLNVVHDASCATIAHFRSFLLDDSDGVVPKQRCSAC